jgi:hypothetical protein
MYRLENGKLKGTRIQNSHGQEEWRVYPNREIMQAVQSKVSPSMDHSLDFNPSDVVDSVVIDDVEDVDGSDGDSEKITSEAVKPRDLEQLVEIFREQFAPEIVAEKLMKPLIEKLELQQELLVQQRLELSDKDRQLRLLPDLQKQAEDRAKQLELEHVEKEALKKQVEALAQEKAQLEAELAESRQGFWKRMFSWKSDDQSPPRK